MWCLLSTSINLSRMWGKNTSNKLVKSLGIQYKEHTHTFKTDSNVSKFAQHISHNFCPYDQMEDVMDIIQLRKTGCHMNTIKRFYIYKVITNNSQLSHKVAVGSSTIFETCSKIYCTSESTIPTENDMIMTVGRNPHNMVYIYIQNSVCNQ